MSAPYDTDGQRTLDDAILAALRAAGAAGMMRAEVFAACHHTRERSTGTRMSVLWSAGLLRRRLEPTGRSGRYYRYWIAQAAPADAEAAPAPQRILPPHLVRPAGGSTAHLAPRQLALRRLHLDHNQPTIVPPGVLVQVCPAGRDTRYTVAPGERVAGCGFVAEWERLLGRRRRGPVAQGAAQVGQGVEQRRRGQAHDGAEQQHVALQLVQRGARDAEHQQAPAGGQQRQDDQQRAHDGGSVAPRARQARSADASC